MSKDSITPSAINSWIGEEVRPVAVEATLAAEPRRAQAARDRGAHAANDTAGTLLTFRGWALHDRTTLAFGRQPLPPLGTDWPGSRRHRRTRCSTSRGLCASPGYYAKLAWQPPLPVRVELFRYDNRANPRTVDADLEWGWRTRFDDAGVVADLGSGAELKAQAMQGRTRMGFPMPATRWVDERFRAAFVLLSRPFGKVGIAARAEAFDTRNRGSLWTVNMTSMAGRG